MAWWKIALLAAAGFLLLAVGGVWYYFTFAELDIYKPLYADNCAGCHGVDLRGTEEGGSLLEGRLRWGETVAGLIVSIRDGDQAAGMPAYRETLTEDEIKGLAIFIGERRLGQTFRDFKYDKQFEVPGKRFETEEHAFHLQTLATGLGDQPYSIAPLPDGNILLSEKNKGVSLVSPDGKVSDYIQGTPSVTEINIDAFGLKYGVGWLQDIALHPDYASNGWIYLHYTELCEDKCDSTIPVSMNRIERGRIRDGHWVDVEVIWEVAPEYYNEFPDTAAGGRLAFDGKGHLYFSVGMKGIYGSQDLNLPYGKIYRIRDDGAIPPDNPFVVKTHVNTATKSAASSTASSATNSTASSAVSSTASSVTNLATTSTAISATGSDANLDLAALGKTADSTPGFLASVWTYGHRSPQGLEWNPLRQAAWNSEMGPRGGDELNELLPGANYGWPYHSHGLEYTGGKVERHKGQNKEFNLDDTVQTLVNITPSPAISSFVFYEGDLFPSWRNQVLIGSLKGSSLFRMVFDGNKLIHQETLIKDLARIRDIEVGFDGMIYLLLENKHGSAIVKLVPADHKQS